MQNRLSLYANVFAEKRWNIEILTRDNGWLAFFEAAARDWFELQNFLFRLGRFFQRLLWCWLFSW